MSPQQSPPPPPHAGDNSSSRLSFQEYMQLVPLPEQPHAYGTPNGQPQQKRYMSQRASWMPGIDLPSPMREHMTFKGAAYGGHVYSQSGLAASLTFAEMREKLIKAGKGKGLKGKVFGIHVSYFSLSLSPSVSLGSANYFFHDSQPTILTNSNRQYTGTSPKPASSTGPSSTK